MKKPEKLSQSKKLNRLLLLYLLVLLPVFQSAAQTRLHLVYTDKPDSLHEVFSVSDSSEARSKLLEIQQTDHDNAYFFAGYDSIRRVDDGIKAWYFRGEQFSWDTALLAEPENVHPGIVDINHLMSRPPSPLRLKHWIEKTSESLNRYYPLAVLSVDSIVPVHQGKLTIFLSIENAHTLTFEDFDISGFHDFPKEYLYTRIHMFPGDVYSASKLERIESVLQMMPFAEAGEKWYAETTDSTFIVNLPLKEVQASSFSGILGLLPGDEKQNLYLTGQLDLKLVNVLKRAESIAMQWQSPDQESQELDLGVDFPLVYKALGLAGNFTLEKKDSSFVNLALHGELRYLRGLSTSSFFYEYEQSNSLLLSDNPLFANVRSDMFGLAYRYRKLNHLVNPSQGTELNFRLSAGRRYGDDMNPGVKGNLSLDLRHYLPFGKNISLKTALNSRYILAEDLYRNELVRLGGIGSMRAYQTSSFWTSAYALCSADLIFYPDENSSLYVFAESGIISSDFGVAEGTFYPFAGGAGVLITTNLGGLSLSYGVGRSFDAFLDLRQSQINIGYVNNF